MLAVRERQLLHLIGGPSGVRANAVESCRSEST